MADGDASMEAPKQTRSGREIVARFMPELWQHRGLLVWSYLCCLLGAATVLATPWPLKYLIDNVLGDEPMPDWLHDLIGSNSTASIVITLAIATALIGVAGTFVAGVEQIVNAKVRERLACQLRNRLLAHVQTLPLAFRNADRSGEIALRLVDDVNQFVRLLSKTGPRLASHAITAVCAFIALFLLDPLFGLVGFVIFALISGLTIYLSRSLRLASKAKRHREGEVAGLAQEIVRSLPTTMALGTEAKVQKRFADTNQSSQAAGIDEAHVAVRMERVIEIVKAVGRALIIGSGGLLVLKGSLTVGSLTVGIAYLAHLMKPLAKINELASTISRALARGERLVALLDRQPDIIDHSDAIRAADFRYDLVFDQVSFTYRSPDSETIETVFSGVNLRIQKGQFVVIVGPSGSGKSTLLALLLRLYDPTGGRILIDSAPYADIRLKSLREQFAVMMQETHLFAGTVREALQPSGQRVSDRTIWAMLSKVSMDNFMRALPGGLDAQLAENGQNLSGGQRARLSLARAMLREAPVLLLDEPLANVDPESQAVILDALAELRGRCTCIAVTHQLALARLADRVLTLEDRAVLELDPNGIKHAPLRALS